MDGRATQTCPPRKPRRAAEAGVRQQRVCDEAEEENCEEPGAFSPGA